MGAIENNCPKKVREAGMYFDTLQAFRQYQGGGTHIVDVPPVVDIGDPIPTSISGGDSLTQSNGGTFADGKTRVGWDTPSEREFAADLLARATEMQTTAANGQLHGDSTARVEALTDAAIKELKRIEAIYALWANARIKAKKSDSPFSFYKQMDGSGPLPLSESRNWIAAFADIATVNSHPDEYFSTFAGLLQGERGDWSGVGEPTGPQFWSALTAARRRDRDGIRNKYRYVLKAIWCAEFAVAESESYELNKGDAEPLIMQATPVGPKPPVRVGILQLPTDPPPVSEHDPIPEETPAPDFVEPAWYTTTPAKVALGLAGAALVGAAGYGVYRLAARRPAPAPTF